MKQLKSLNKGFGLNIQIDAREVHREISKIKMKTPENIVEVARHKSSPLHKYFEWDDSIAAHKYRLTQARTLVLSIGFEENGQLYREFESVVLDGERSYVSVENIAQSQDLIAQVLRQALDDLTFFKQKHQRWSSFFSGLFDEITKAEEAYRRKYGKNKEKSASRSTRIKRGKRVKADHSADKKANRSDNDHRGIPPSR